MKERFPPTSKKVAMNTCEEINENIRNQTINCINIYKESCEDILNKKISKLSYEWDIERVIETNAASMVLISSILGFKKKKSCFFLFSGALGLFLLQHALYGQCPSLPLLRSMGFRTSEEINNEKTALKMIRGDFLQNTNNAEELLEIAEK